MKFLKNLQKKSRSTRLLILWLASFLVMVIILAIWLISFSQNFQSEEAEEDIKTTDLPSLFESIEKDFSIFRQQLQGSIKNIEEIYEQEAPLR
jgi:cytoskeletal protein RodZ